MNRTKRIGVFDSGYGGLTVLSEIRRVLPDYDYVYLGDNARAPYGNRSYEVVYQFTLQAVKKLFDLDCDLVILACNTASAKALRSIQQRDLPNFGRDKRVLGVIRPTTEVVGKFTSTGHIGILGTTGTVKSESYIIELKKEYPDVIVHQEACPLWVPLIENNAHDSLPGHLIVEQNVTNLMERESRIDVLLLACTHYPLVKPIIERVVQASVQVVPQGEIVALSLKDYLTRHTWMEEKLAQNGLVTYLTTEHPETFEEKAELFLGTSVGAERVVID